MRHFDRIYHRLAPLKRDTIPAVHVILDTETVRATRGRRSGQRFACGALALVRRSRSGAWSIEGAGCFDLQRLLWDRFVDLLAPRGRSVVWAHNLAFDLHISGALSHLPRRGWDIEGVSVEQHACWASMVQPGRSLLWCDLASHLPAKLDTLCQRAGPIRPAFDYEGATLAELRERCVWDVEAEARHVVTLLDFYEREHCGSLKPTGAGQCWAAFRRGHLHVPITVHCEAGALEAERTAMWAGRCEAFRHGECRPGPFYEWDLSLAYARIAAECAVPVRYVSRVGERDLTASDVSDRAPARLSYVTVRTDVPVLPAGVDGAITWPVGEFRTWCWSPELSAALAAGAQLHQHHGYTYERAPALAGMAAWLIRCLEDPNAALPEPLPVLAKYWCRALVGRCALRYRSWEPWGVAGRSRLGISMMYEAEGDGAVELLQVGRRIFAQSGMREGNDSVPQITSWIMSECRRRLWELIVAVGPEHVLYTDTDSLIVDAAGHRTLVDLDSYGMAYHAVCKRRITSLTIHGPRMLWVDEQRRAAGIPRNARAAGAGKLEGDTWRSLRGSLALGEDDLVVISHHDYAVRGTDLRREHRPGGETQPRKVKVHDGNNKWVTKGQARGRHRRPRTADPGQPPAGGVLARTSAQAVLPGV